MAPFPAPDSGIMVDSTPAMVKPHVGPLRYPIGGYGLVSARILPHFYADLGFMSHNIIRILTKV